MESLDVSSTTSVNSDHQHREFMRNSFGLVCDSLSRGFNQPEITTLNTGGTFPTPGRKREASGLQAFICLYIVAVDTM